MLKEIIDIEGIRELDFISCHPGNTSVELFKLMGQSPKIKKQLHLPFQSGSDRILKKMNRGYTKKDYLSLVDNYRKIVKGGAIGTDVIVGFPGETEEDFLETKEVLETVKFDYAYLFKYSPRQHSSAYDLNDDVPLEVKKQRHAVLLDLQKFISNNNYEL